MVTGGGSISRIPFPHPPPPPSSKYLTDIRYALILIYANVDHYVRKFDDKSVTRTMFVTDAITDGVVGIMNRH